jgi:hypothetical protein
MAKQTKQEFKVVVRDQGGEITATQIQEGVMNGILGPTISYGEIDVEKIDSDGRVIDVA